MPKKPPKKRDFTRDPAPPARRTVPASAAPSEDAAVPEWMTETWKRRVEAEARQRLKTRIRGISTRR